MRKIPTLYRRAPEDMSRVLREINPDCLWVLDGEGVPTRKLDGTCLMFDGAVWWARREVKPGKAAPTHFQALETDLETGKTVGWEPVDQSSFAKQWGEAVERYGYGDPWPAGTYELAGPKINGNPERLDGHCLLSHDDATRLANVPRDFDGLMAWLLDHDGIYEGVVWHHPDGRMAKLKVRDAKATVGQRPDEASS